MLLFRQCETGKPLHDQRRARRVNQEKIGRHTATYEVHLRGLTRHVYAVRDGTLTVDPADNSSIDVRISAEPVTWLLTSYGRINQWWPALSGKITARGRRPWLAATFARRFLSP